MGSTRRAAGGPAFRFDLPHDLSNVGAPPLSSAAADDRVGARCLPLAGGPHLPCVGKCGAQALPLRSSSRILKGMEVHFTPETEKKLKDLATQSGRGTDDLVEDAMAGYFDEVLQAREMLNSRYDDLKSGKVKPIDGEEAFARLKANTEAQRNRPA